MVRKVVMPAITSRFTVIDDGTNPNNFCNILLFFR